MYLLKILFTTTILLSNINTTANASSTAGNNNNDIVIDGEEKTTTDSSWPMGWKTIRGISFVTHAMATVVAVFFCIAILTNSNTRGKSYNLYLVCLVFPDAILNGNRTIVSIYDILRDGIRSASITQSAVWCWFYSTSCNFWLGAVVAYEVNNLVHKSYRRIRVPPLSLLKVGLQVLAVHLAAILLATWSIVPTSWSLTQLSYKPEGGTTTKIGNSFFSEVAACIILYSMMILPASYVVFVRWRTKNKLPRRGKTRTLSLYFMRILFLFFAFYIPSTIFSLARSLLSNQVAYFCLTMVLSFLEAFQTMTGVYLAGKNKYDVRMAIQDCFWKAIRFTFCQRFKNEHSNKKRRSSGMTEVSRRRSKPNSWEEDDVYNTNRRRPSIVKVSHAVQSFVEHLFEKADKGDVNFQMEEDDSVELNQGYDEEAEKDGGDVAPREIDKIRCISEDDEDCNNELGGDCSILLDDTTSQSKETTVTVSLHSHSRALSNKSLSDLEENVLDRKESQETTATIAQAIAATSTQTAAAAYIGTIPSLVESVLPIPTSIASGIIISESSEKE